MADHKSNTTDPKTGTDSPEQDAPSQKPASTGAGKRGNDKPSGSPMKK